jgi:hypothetical protein
MSKDTGLPAGVCLQIIDTCIANATPAQLVELASMFPLADVYPIFAWNPDERDQT